MTSLKSVAIVGATGAVGSEMLTCLETRKFPVRDLRLLASASSAGKTARFNGREIALEALDGSISLESTSPSWLSTLTSRSPVRRARWPLAPLLSTILPPSG